MLIRRSGGSGRSASGGYDCLPVKVSHRSAPQQSRPPDCRVGLTRHNERWVNVRLCQVRSSTASNTDIHRYFGRRLLTRRCLPNTLLAAGQYLTCGPFHKRVFNMHITRPGDAWIIGCHKLLCGDATDRNTVARLMADEKADLCFTSPPYLHQRKYIAGVGDWDALMRGVFGNLPMHRDGQVLVNLGLVHRKGEVQIYWHDWQGWMRASGWNTFGWYVWDKGMGCPATGAVVWLPRSSFYSISTVWRRNRTRPKRSSRAQSDTTLERVSCERRMATCAQFVTETPFSELTKCRTM